MENNNLIKNMDELIFTNKDFSKKLSKLVHGILQDYANRGIYFVLDGLDDPLSIDIIAAPNGLLPIFIVQADEIYKELFDEPLDYNMVLVDSNEDDPEEKTFMNLYVDVVLNEKNNAIVWTHIMSYAIEDLIIKRKYELNQENELKKKSNFTVSIDNIFDIFHEHISEERCSVIRERDLKEINEYKI